MLGKETDEGLLDIGSEDKFFHRPNDNHEVEKINEEDIPREIGMASDKRTPKESRQERYEER